MCELRSHLLRDEIAADLMVRYPGQAECQPVHVVLDCDTGDMRADHNPEIGNAVPSAVWHGRTLWYGLNPLSNRRVNELLAEIAPLAQKVLDGYEVVWDGSNLKAQLTAEAEAADAQIDRICGSIESDCALWDASASGTLADWGITAQTTDEDIDAIVDEHEVTEDDGVIRVIEGLADYLTEGRDALLAEAGDDGN